MEMTACRVAIAGPDAAALGWNQTQRSQIRRTQPNNVSNYLSPPHSPPKADRLPAVNPFHRCRDLHRWCRHGCICTGHGQTGCAVLRLWLWLTWTTPPSAVASSPRFMKAFLDAHTDSHQLLAGRPLVQGRRQDRCCWYALQFCKTPLRSDLYLLADADQVCLSVESSLFSCQVFILFFFSSSSQVDCMLNQKKKKKWIACSEWHGKRFLLWGTWEGGASLWVVFLWSGSVGRYLWAHHSSGQFLIWNGSFQPRLCPCWYWYLKTSLLPYMVLGKIILRDVYFCLFLLSSRTQWVLCALPPHNEASKFTPALLARSQLHKAAL